ncbi:MAG: type II secretion system F family protein, partial [Alcanivoracaceae bacterium]
MAKKDKKLDKTATFLYKGKDKRGTKVKGEITGKSAAAVKLELRKQGITANSVNKKLELPIGGKPKVTAADIAVFTRQMATMMKAGVPLVQSFEIVADGLDNSSLREIILGIKAEVEGGNNFGGALRKYPDQFDNL